MKKALTVTSTPCTEIVATHELDINGNTSRFKLEQLAPPEHAPGLFTGRVVDTQATKPKVIQLGSYRLFTELVGASRNVILSQIRQRYMRDTN